MVEAAEPGVLVFVPSYGDAEALPEIVAGVTALGTRYRCLVVDDGSPIPVAVPSCALRVRLPANFGLGISTHVAFDHVLRHGHRALVRVDADGQHAVEDIPRLMSDIDARRADVVVGSRANHGQDRSSLGWGRRLLKGYFNLAARIMTGSRAPADVNSGFFALNAVAIAVLNRSTFERFPEPEIFVSACRAGLRVASVQVEQRQRTHGISTLGIFAAMQMFFRFNVYALNEVLLRRRP